MEYEGKLFGKVGSTYIPLAPTTKDVEALQKENAALRAKLEMIRDRDWVENVLDPQWAHYIARAALVEIKEE